MDTKSHATASNLAKPTISRFKSRMRRGSYPLPVRAHNPRPRDPQAYPSSRPRPAAATRPLLSFEWTDVKPAERTAMAPVAVVPVAVVPAAEREPEYDLPPMASEMVSVSEPVHLGPSQRAHLMRPLTLRGMDGRKTYVTYTFDRQ